MIALFTALLMAAFSAAGCSGDPAGGSGGASSAKKSSNVSETATEVSGEESGEVSGTESGPASSGAVSGNKSSSKKAESGSTSSKKSSTSSPSGNAGDSFDTDKQPVFKEQVKNLGKKTIKIASSWNEWVLTSGAPPMQVAAVKALRDIEKDYNCTIEAVTVNPTTFAADVATAHASGKVYADIYETYVEDTLQKLNPYVEDVSKVSSLGLSSNDWNAFIGSQTVIRGVQHGVGFMMTQNLAVSQTLVYFNKTLADKYNIGDLYAEVRAGNWTYNRFLQATQKISQATGGATKGTLLQHVSVLEHVLYANNAKPIGKDNDGYFFDYNNQALLNALQFWSDYDKAGYIVTSTGSGQYGAAEAADFRQRKALFYIGDYICASAYFNPYMEDNYGVLPLPKGPNSNGYTSFSAAKCFSLAKDNPNREDAGRILVAIAKRTGWNMKEWDQIQLETALRDKASLEMMKLVFNAPNQVGISVRMGLTDLFLSSILEVVLEQKNTPAAAMQQIRALQQASVNSLYN
jgi:hypothetical protein